MAYQIEVMNIYLVSDSREVRSNSWKDRSHPLGGTNQMPRGKIFLGGALLPSRLASVLQ